MSLVQDASIKLFRSSAPYINAHRGKTFVLMVSGEAVAHANFATIIHDIALLNSLGVRLVLVHGARSQVNERLMLRGIESKMHKGFRVTDKATLECVKDAAGSVRSQIEALLTMGLANSPMHGSAIRVCSGNLVVAKPFGVHDGIDFENTGLVRRIDTHGIRDHLDDGSIVLLSPIGYSSTGEVFSLSHEDIATSAAISLKADKLIIFSAQDGLERNVVQDNTQQGELLRNLDLNELLSLAEKNQLQAEDSVLRAVIETSSAGVDRVHCVSYKHDGAMLKELFTRDGVGTLVMKNHYEKLRPATIDDVGGIIKLINPLEESGALVKRSRERLEDEINQFTVIERDGMIIACAALYIYEDAYAELACVATHPDYRGKHRGERLLEAIKERAQKQLITRLFVLTTVTSHWFLEQGFLRATVDELPEARKTMYNYQRNSMIYVLDLTKAQKLTRL